MALSQVEGRQSNPILAILVPKPLAVCLCILYSILGVSSANQIQVLTGISQEEKDKEEFASICQLGYMIRENPGEIEDTEECAVSEAGGFDAHEDLPVLFALILMCAWGAFIRAVTRHYSIKIPYTVILLISGLIIGAFSQNNDLCPIVSKYTAIARISPKHILYTFLPILIFESAFNIPVHTFYRTFFQIVILAFPGMIICTLGSAYLSYEFFTEYKWTFLQACLFGCIVSATDPVAVVAILRDLGVNEQLSVLIDGESLLNDGMAILMFELFHEYVLAGTSSNHPPETLWHIVLHVGGKFAQIALGGPVFGWFVGKIVIFYLSYVYNDATVEISTMVCASYLTYWCSEYFLHVSGVIAVVSLGITLGAERTVISPESEGPVHHFWEMLGYLANTVLFVLVGIVISENAVQHFGITDFQYLALLYIGLHVVRLLMLMMFYPILTRMGYGLEWQNMIIIMWGGLRGAVGICLALEIYQDETLCPKQDVNIGPKILFHTAGIVLLTLVVNGTTTKGLLKTLKLTEVTLGQKDEMNNALRKIRKCNYNMIRSFQMGTWMVDARWDLVAKICMVENPYAPQVKPGKSKKGDYILIQPPQPVKDNATICHNCHSVVENEPTIAEYREMTNAARLRAIKSMKIHYHHLFEQGTLTEQATQNLLKDAENAEDREMSVIQAQSFHKYMKARGFNVWLRDKVIIHFKLHKGEELPAAPENMVRYWFWWLVTRHWFEIASFLVVVLNMITVIWDVCLIYTSKYSDDQCKWTPTELNIKFAFQYANYIFASFYSFEIFAKLIGLGVRIYFCNAWNYLDIIVLGVTYADIWLYEIALDPVLCKTKNVQFREYLNIIKGLRFIQFLRSLRLLRPLVPVILRKIRRQTNYQVFIGYDMGKGFVETSDAVMKFIPQLAENKKVQKVIKHAIKRERNACSNDLALIHRKFPGVVLALKTRHACRAALNQMFYALNEVKEGGLLDDPDIRLLKHMLDEKSKRLNYSPTYYQPTKALTDTEFVDQLESKVSIASTMSVEKDIMQVRMQQEQNERKLDGDNQV